MTKPARQKSSSTVAIGRSHINVQHVDSVPTRPEFKSALSTMHGLKRVVKKKQEALAQTSSSSSSWHWHSSWWESDFEHSPQKWHDR